MIQSIVLGLDRANWDLLSPWLEAGDLENSQLLREQGTTGDRISITDVVPTIPDGHGSAIPSEMAGKPLGLFNRKESSEGELIVSDFVDQRSNESFQN